MIRGQFKRFFKSLMAIALAIIMVVTGFPLNYIFEDFGPSITYASTPFDNPIDLTQNQSMANIPEALRYNSKGVQINASLYNNLGIVAYGKLNENSPIGNEFYPGYQSNGVVYEGKGRFLHPTEGQGEYRYLGMDFQNNLYLNPYYPSDFKRNAKTDASKRWILKPWDTLPSWYPYKPDNAGAVYNSGERSPASNSDPAYSLIKQNLDKAINFSIKRGIIPDKNSPRPLNSNFTNAPFADGQDIADYAVIHTAPGLFNYGSATLYHYNTISASNVLYIGFPMEPLSVTGGRNMTPSEGWFKMPANSGAIPAEDVIATINLKDPKYLSKKEIEIDIPVVGSLLDDSYFLNPVKRFNFYTRYDLKDFTMRLTGAGLNMVKDNVSKLQNKTLSNTAFQKVKIPVDSIPSDGKYQLTLYTKANFLDGKSTTEHRVQKFIKFTNTNAPKLITEFSLNEAVIFKKVSEFQSASTGYKNTTPANQDYNEITIEVKDIASGQSMTPFTSTKSGFTDANAQAKIRAFISTFFTDQEIAGQKTENFEVTQTIRNTSRNISATLSKRISVSQGDKDIPVKIDRPNGSVIITPPVQEELITPNANIPDKWYDVVKYPANDSTTGWIDRTVSVNGIPVDDDQFFNGDWVAGTDLIGLQNVYIEWKGAKGSIASLDTWTVIYDTKPRVQIAFEGLWKQNRSMKATNTSDSVNDKFVTDAYPMSYTFEFVGGKGGDDSSLRTRANTNMLKEFMYKQPGVYALSLTATNSLGRVSDPYIVEFEILPDEKPAVIVHTFDGQVPRGEKVDLFTDFVSVDGDDIDSSWIKLWYDSDNNGSYETLINTYPANTTELTPPANLGKYKIEGYALEKTSQSLFSEFITPSDFKSNTYEAFFEVANFRPMSDMYVENPVEKPLVDVYFMLDKNLAQSKTNYMNGNEVSNANLLIGKNLNPVVDTWDMRTYTYSTPASTYSNTGGSYPPATIPFSSNGYSGSLTRTSVSNSPYSVDHGSYQTRNVTSTESSYFSDTCTNTRTRDKYWDAATKSYKYTAWSGSDSECPSSIYISGWGSIPRTSTDLTYDSELVRSWTAYYGGTLSRSVTTTETYWVPNWVSYNDYTGYYSGTIYKDVRQPYDNKFMRTTSKKFVVYISDGNISELADLQRVMRENSADLILVGAESIQSQIAHSKFINATNKSIETIVGEVIDNIAQIAPPVERIYRLINESTTVKTGNADIENDAISDTQMKVWWDPNWFSQVDGFENSEGPHSGVATSYDSASWTAFNPTMAFNKPGKYNIIRRIKDRATSNPLFDEYNLWSNESQIELITHRKPIADVILDWDYDQNQNNYLTTWIDNSYDLDHQFNHPQKGIVERALSLTNHTTGITYNTIPTRITHGSYTLSYAAKDVEGAWSDTITRSFTLNDIPPVQFNGSLRSQLAKFSLSSIPASENLVAHSLWTRYPYQLYLNMTMNTINQNINYYTGSKVGNDINWSDVTINIPNTTADGTYPFTMRAIAQSGGGATASRTFNVTVFTPINLVPVNPVSNSSLTVNIPTTIRATTTKYPSTLTATMFLGTAYATTLNLTSTLNGDDKDWSVGYTVPNTVPDGSYNVRFTATNPSGKTQTVTVPITVTRNRPPVAQFDWSPKPVWEGDDITLIDQSTDPDAHDAGRLTLSWSAIRVSNGGSLSVVTVNGKPTVRGLSGLTGTVRVTLVATDTYGLQNSITKDISVSPLQITSNTVSHTTDWEKNRRDYNMKKSGNINSPRAANVFWAGENFVLNVGTTNTGMGGTTASSVVASFGSYSVSLTPSSNNSVWNGVLSHRNFEKLPDGPLVINFVATWSNGISRSANSTVIIDGDWVDFFNEHRAK